METTGVIFNIQRFSIHDGPGIRTTVFFKGCPLRCFWCHNPEGLRLQPELHFFPDRCIGCGECVTTCPRGAHVLEQGTHVFHRDLCIACGRCADTCYTNALELTGRHMTVHEVLEEVLRDRAFYDTSGGGVTLSGGEPLLQREFAVSLLSRCKEKDLHTAVETAASCQWKELEEILPFTDLFMIDIKHMNPDRHREVTGLSNERILSNIARVLSTGIPLTVRVPVIPGINADPQTITDIARFVSETAARASSEHRNVISTTSLELLPFHRMAGDKYRSLGLEYKAADLETPSSETMESLRQSASRFGMDVRRR
ncbi:MAG: glycyl-radical enzyme activating protein [Chloroflexi bacterium]|nr:glycyl-radical enzyme activating protein [Chloroflexota bacterium]